MSRPCCLKALADKGLFSGFPVACCLKREFGGGILRPNGDEGAAHQGEVGDIQFRRIAACEGDGAEDGFACGAGFSGRENRDDSAGLVGLAGRFAV